MKKLGGGHGSHLDQRLFSSEGEGRGIRELVARRQGQHHQASGVHQWKFHKSIKPDSKFNFINVAIWESEDVYWKAYEKSITPMKTKLQQLGVEMVPALYQVAFEY
jgi:hypothetical protein